MDEQERQKITILLAEYNTLRAEIIAAKGSAWQAVSLIVPVIVAIVGFYVSTTMHPTFSIVGSGVGFIVVIILFAVWGVDMSTRKFAGRLRELEDDINRRAGERLLLWENEHGWGSMLRKTHVPNPPQSN